VTDGFTGLSIDSPKHMPSPDERNQHFHTPAFNHERRRMEQMFATERLLRRVRFLARQTKKMSTRLPCRGRLICRRITNRQFIREIKLETILPWMSLPIFLAAIFSGPPGFLAQVLSLSVVRAPLERWDLPFFQLPRAFQHLFQWPRFFPGVARNELPSRRGSKSANDRPFQSA
jgi:hypothetical protein